MASNLSFFAFNTKNSTNLLHINIYGYQPVEYYIILQQKINNWNAAAASSLWQKVGNRTFPIAHEGDREALSLNTVECIVLLTLWFIILSCLGRCNKRPSHIILLNRSIVHAIRLHVSEEPSSARSDHISQTNRRAQKRSGTVQNTQCGYTFRK